MSKIDKRMAKAAIALLLVALMVLIPLSVALAAGQPSVDCADFSTRPGNSSTAPGSAFNENGMAGTVYAGEQPQNSNNVNSVSQYDVACEKVSR